MLFFRCEFDIEYDLDKLSLSRFNKDAEMDDEKGCLIREINRIAVGRGYNSNIEGLVCIRMTDIRMTAILSTGKNISRISGYLKEIKKDLISLPVVKEIGTLALTEISVSDYRELIMEAQNVKYVPGVSFRWFHDIGLDYFNNDEFAVSEELCDTKKLTNVKAKKMSEKMLWDVSLVEEMDRIYDKSNKKKFVSHPVHYRIEARDKSVAIELAKNLVRMLYSNKRLLGTRLNIIKNIDTTCFSNNDLKSLLEKSAGSTCFIDTTSLSNSDGGSSQDLYLEVSDFIGKEIKKNCSKTLFIFFEQSDKRGFFEHLWEEIASDIRLVDINEGRFEGTESGKYLKELINQGEYKMYSDHVPQIEADKVYTASDIQDIYEKWKDSCLTECIYPAYKNTAKACKRTNGTKKSDCYNKLMEMTGLEGVKSTIDSIIAFSKMSKKKAELGMRADGYNNHMVFTGNPGTAKTTAARLIADILKAEGVLASGKFVECGRADLVGKFVGWTAKNVRKKFEEAKGGILFIDEAYSLCEDRNSFGTEAINTIVQEMENNRKHVLVIFAGYPDKMKDFMEMNEGLHSRIGFHIDFPDYNSDELLQILKFQAKERGYTIAKQSDTKLLRQFDDARKIKNYGNGRFVRNLLDQAIMKQSLRLSLSETGGQPGAEELSTLYTEDFEVQVLNFQKPSNKIGFVS